MERICTYGLFEDLNTGKQFLVFNTHFDHVGIEARKNASALILEKIKELNPKNLPAFVSGDLNLEPDSAPIAVLKTELDDTHELAPNGAFGPKGTFNGFKFTEPVTRRIDYIFQVKSNTSKVLVAGGEGSNNLLYLPLDKLMSQSGSGSSSSSSSGVPPIVSSDSSARTPASQQRDLRSRESR